MDRSEPILDQITSKIGGGKPTKSDAIAGVTTGIANIPDGMASAVLGGVNPIYGIYTLIIGTPISALTQSTQLMMFNTTSAMTLVAADGLGDRSGDERVKAIIVVALIAGIMQLSLGLLGLGMLTKFVSNSVMVGFLTGIAALIIMGQLWSLTGFEGESDTKLADTASLLQNLGDIDPATTAIGIGTIALMVGLTFHPKLRNFNLLIALGVAIAVQYIFDFASVSLVGGIPGSLPSIVLPEFSVAPEMLLAGIATGVVGLLQAAGVAQAYPNPDGSESSDSKDFAAQGIANISSSFFQGMAGGGSLSGTALNVSAGARTRYAAIAQAGVVLVAILVFADLLAKIPSAALAGLLIYAAYLSIKFDAIETVRKTSRVSLISMVLTFLATLVVPLQQAVIFGVIAASILYIYRASTDVRVSTVEIEDGHLVVSDPPETLSSNKVTVLDIAGNLFYAGSSTLGDRLPDAKDASHAFVVMRVRGQSEVGSTFFKMLGTYAGQIADGGGKLILAGVEPEVKARMERTGQLDAIGPDNVFLSNSIIGDSTSAAFEYGNALLSGVPADQLESAQPAVERAGADKVREPMYAEAAETEPVVAGDSAAIDAEKATVLHHIARLVDRYLPWRSTATWRSIAILGCGALILGLVFELAPDLMDGVFRGVLGGLFLAVAVFWMYQTYSRPGSQIAVPAATRMLSAGIAFMVGSALLLSDVTDLMSENSARLLSQFGLIYIGLLGIMTATLRPAGSRERLAAIALNGLVVILGGIGLYQLENGRSFYQSLSWLLMILGAAMIIYSIYMFQFRSNQRRIVGVASDVEETSNSDIMNA